MKLSSLLFITLWFAACAQVKPVWVNTTDLKTPESALYSPAFKTIFVSNINGDPTAKDGNGYIAMLNDKGRALASPWVEGLNAPKGMAIANKILFVTDIDTLVSIDIEKSTISNKWVVPGSKFLNDVAAAPDGTIYFSDMMDNAIYVLKNNAVELFIKDNALEAPNGLFVKDNKLFVATWGIITEGFATSKTGRIITIDLASKAITPYMSDKPIGNLDGLEFVDDGFFVSDWMVGKIFKGNSSGKIKQILDLGQGAADIGIIPDTKILLVPQMMTNELKAYSY